MVQTFQFASGILDVGSLCPELRREDPHLAGVIDAGPGAAADRQDADKPGDIAAYASKTDLGEVREGWLGLGWGC